MNCIKLVNFEVQRFFKFFIVLVLFVVIAQMIGAFTSASNFIEHAELVMQEEQLLANEYVAIYNSYSMQSFLYSGLFILSIIFSAAVLMIYVLFIWYRDWFGKASFIYRLLMLPTERSNVYLAKLTTILLLMSFLVGVQVVLLEVVQRIIKLIIPAELRTDVDTNSLYSNELLEILYPQTFVQFLFTYGIGIVIVATFFTAILLERSLHLKGTIIAVIYVAFSQLILFAPMLIKKFSNYFYEYEIYGMLLTSELIVLVIAVVLANYLLKRKIHV